MGKEQQSQTEYRNEDQPDTEEDDRQDQDQKENRSDQIYYSGSVTPEGGRHKIHCLTIIGQVEGHYILPPQNKTTKYEHVIPQLVAIEQDSSIKGLLIILNTVGGDVEAGLAIAELVSGMKTPTVSLVLGGGHSIGVPLAVSAQYSFIAPTATMTVHPVRMNGVLLGVPQTLSYFDKMQERITSFVCQNSRIPPKRFKELMMNSGELVMDIGTVLDGEMAVEEGLIDSLGGLNEAVEKLYELIEAQPDKEELEDRPPDASKGPQKAGRSRKKTRREVEEEPEERAAKKPGPAPKRSPGRPRKKQPARPAAALPVPLPVPPLPPIDRAVDETEPPRPRRRPGRPRKEG